MYMYLFVACTCTQPMLYKRPGQLNLDHLLIVSVIGHLISFPMSDYYIYFALVDQRHYHAFFVIKFVKQKLLQSTPTSHEWATINVITKKTSRVYHTVIHSHSSSVIVIRVT